MEKATNKAQRLLQATVDGLTDDQIQGINDGLRCFEESLMTTKDRTALLQYWVSVSKRNVGFRDWLAIQLHSIDGPQVATAFEQLTSGALETCAAVHYSKSILLLLHTHLSFTAASSSSSVCMHRRSLWVCKVFARSIVYVFICSKNTALEWSTIFICFHVSAVLICNGFLAYLECFTLVMYHSLV